VLYLEQPAGVGFSHPTGAANDAVTANDTLVALVAFLQTHPELQGRPFYIAGESYGGHYVPNLAKAIQTHNAAATTPVSLRIPLKGIAVGNGYADWQLDFNMNVPFGRYHALSSIEQFQAAQRACDGDFARCFWPRDDVPCPKECDAAVTAATVNAMDGSIDIYDIYEDVCLEGKSRQPTAAFLLEQERRRAVERMRAVRGTLSTTPISPIFPTCADNYNSAYLNLPQVQEAIHVDRSSIPGGNWSDCGGVDYTFNYESVLPDYRKWTSAGTPPFDILIYSGDADFILNHMGSVNWIAAATGLNASVAVPWQKWLGSDGQVAGYYEIYTGLTFLTVKGAGHFVPKDRPRHALDMLRSFLAQLPYNKVPRSSIPAEPLCPARPLLD